MSHRRHSGKLGSIARALGWILIGALGLLVAGIVIYLDSRPALSVWHTIHLTEEFSAHSGIDTFDDYLALEQRLFKELEAKVYDAVPQQSATPFLRYNKGSRTDPTSAQQDWNRSFELQAEDPAFGVLLLHGLSDSPYSLRDLGLQLHKEGAHVIGLRVPGHGTIPSGLSATSFLDMAAAVDIAMVHLRETVGQKKIFIVGYSNGGALALDYAARAVQGAAPTEPDGLILLSPEIGVSPAAKLARPFDWIGRTFGIRKLQWSSVALEYDPYKYNSFAMRADVTAWDATQSVKTRLQSVIDRGAIEELPPILAFQSTADATVRTSALISEVMDNLKGPGHHLVLFDANQVFASQGLLSGVLDAETLLTGVQRAYDVSVVTNAAPTSFSTVMRHRAAGAQQVDTVSLNLEWPKDVYSLAHVALPFMSRDPVYGRQSAALSDSTLLRLADVPIFGERGISNIPATALIRQHWNPFYAVIQTEASKFVSNR